MNKMRFAVVVLALSFFGISGMAQSDELVADPALSDALSEFNTMDALTAPRELATPSDGAVALDFGVNPADTAADVCARGAAEIQAMAYDPSSRISVYNQGGLLNGGVCWWHSRLQRSSLFLASFRPELPKATHAQGVAIIDALARMDRVVVIPGYANFHEFTADYEHEIIARLAKWQLTDGILHFRWVDGLSGRWHVPARTLQYIMSRIHQMVTVEHRLVFEKLHFNSIASHAYLVIGSRETAQGYDIDVIDSNHPGETLTVHYVKGQTSLYKPDDNQAFVPYLDFEGDFSRLNWSLFRFCNANGKVPATLY
jgi:hypothetical protein